MSEHFYKEFSYAFNSKGLAARFAIDKTPESMYWNLLGIETRQENALSSRLGRIPITTTPLADLNVHTLARLKGTNGNTFRYAGAGQNIYRIAGDLPGVYSPVSGINQLSGNRFSSATYRPSFSSFPYIFFADSSAMLKDNGNLTPLQQWGIFPPFIPATAIIGGSIFDIIDDFGADIGPLRQGFGANGFFVPDGNISPSRTGAISTVNVVSTGAGMVATVITSAPHGIPADAKSGQINLSGLSNLSFAGPWRLQSVAGANTFVCSKSGFASGGAFGGQFLLWTDYFRVDTTSPAAIPVGLMTVTPASMAGIVTGMLLLVDIGAAVSQANVVAQPTTLLNGWGPNGHVGDYELGTAQAHNFPSLNPGGPTLPYTNPAAAYDNNPNTACTANFQHTHQYAGCVWSFAAIAASGNVRTLNVLSSIPIGVTLRSAGVWYSLDGGITWTNIYNATTHGFTWDSVTLPINQDISKVQVMAFLDSHDDMSHYIQDISITESSVPVNTGSPEYVLVASTTATTFSAFFSKPHAAGATIQDANFSAQISGGVTASLVGIYPTNLDIFSFLGSIVKANDASNITFFLNMLPAASVTGLTLQFDVGDGSFTDFYSSVISLSGATDGVWRQFSQARGSFLKNGQAGLSGHTWANVSSYKFLITTSGVVNFKVDNLYMFASGGPNVGPGSLYDYRYTYFNNQTGDESNPSVPMVATAFLAPNNQSILVFLFPSSDPQVTNINIYRRGGTLNTGWTFVDQIPANSTAYLDSFTDAQIVANNPLQLDNDVPVTTTLPVPVNTILGTPVVAGSTQVVTPGSMANIFPNQILTIDSGNAQETVIVQGTTATTFFAYFQLSHAIASVVAASTRQGHAVNLATIAFNQAWLAGDGDNPNRLYYSKINNPEAFPPQNWIEIGTPADPIMAIVFYSGQLFIFSQSRPHRVIVPFPGATPAPFPTASRHGLIANFGFCISEGIVPYLSKDGIYVFQGANSNYASEVIEWLFADKEPNLNTGVPEQDPAQAVNTIMAYTKNEAYVSYLDKLGIQRRVSYDFKTRGWRNDDVPATAMFFEEDTAELVIGRNNGMVYRDRRGDVDNEGTSSLPINIFLQTDVKDQQLPLNNKSYNELTLDVDTGGQQLSVALLFDNGTSPLPLGSFQSAGRSRIPIPINAGNGRLSQNVALQIYGAVTNAAHFYNWHIKAAVEAEFRDSFDSYWIKFGTDEYKIVKQGWFEYVAPDPNGIAFVVYIEGNMLTPAFTFVLPQATVRTAKRVRFPAVKAKIWRVVGLSASQFQLYGESFVEYKSITIAKGYAKVNLGQMITAQGSV